MSGPPTNVRPEAELKQAAQEAEQELTRCEKAMMDATAATCRQQRLFTAAARALKEYPATLYWSTKSERRLPIEIIHLITAHFNLAEVLYRRGRPADRLLIAPTTLDGFHIEFMRDMRILGRWIYNCQPMPGGPHAKFLSECPPELDQWLAFNTNRTSPRIWKRGIEEDSFEEMAVHFKPRRLVAGGVRLTVLGPEGLLKFTVSRPEAIFARMGWLAHGPPHRRHIYVTPGCSATFRLVEDGIVAPYARVRWNHSVMWGGQKGYRRFATVPKLD